MSAWSEDLSIVSSGRTDHESTWIAAAAKVTDVIIGFCGSTVPGHYLRRQHRPPTSTWPLVAAKPTDINMAPEGNPGYSHQYGPWLQSHEHQYSFRRQPRSWTSAWPSAATQSTDINTDPVYMGEHDPWEHHRPRHPHGPQTIVWLRAAAQVSDFLMSFRGKKATDINTDPGCSSIMDLEKAISKFLNI